MRLITALLLALSCRLGSSLAPKKQSSGSLSRRQTLVLAPAFIATAPTPTLAYDDDDVFQQGPKGLQYQVLSEGSGDKPQRGQKVKTSYTLWVGGWPENGGKQVDSSKSFLGDKPFEFLVGVSQVVKGWDLAVMDMKVSGVVGERMVNDSILRHIF